MFAIQDEKTLFPMLVWLGGREELEDGCLEQAYHLAQLPFIHKWVALMPDTHVGMGMPIGGVIATDGVLIPNAVGVDIGCGMAFTATNLQADLLRDTETGSGTLLQAIIGDIMRNIPVGFRHHKTIRPCYTLDEALQKLDDYEEAGELLDIFDEGYYQIGTLGGGNHFIELQENEDGKLCIMLHSGSRHLGKSICDYFHFQAREANRKYYSVVPDEVRLAFLPQDTPLGSQYIRWMNLALSFAKENREKMMLAVKAIAEKWISKYAGTTLEYGQEINCHHNYAALEHHYGKDVWIHRKGATRAQEGELAVIPGSMGSYSYVVQGKGCKESFCSSSHGAGRRYSRKQAMENFSCDQVLLDLKEQGVVLGKNKKQDVAEESRFAYKNIDQVMKNQLDLVTPVQRMKTIGVVKG